MDAQKQEAALGTIAKNSVRTRTIDGIGFEAFILSMHLQIYRYTEVPYIQEFYMAKICSLATQHDTHMFHRRNIY